MKRNWIWIEDLNYGLLILDTNSIALATELLQLSVFQRFIFHLLGREEQTTSAVCR